MSVLELKTIKGLREKVLEYKKQGKKIGFVPTMGYLHDGHLSLVKEAQKQNDIVVVSIFVNPTQFGENEDLSSYPRDLDRDLSLLENYADIVFVPDVQEIYPLKHTIKLIETQFSRILCGKFRGGHFSGVLGIVLKLFNIVNPDNAYFGEKDYQQLTLIKKMVLELNLNINIVGLPLIRENDGLAMSSRNTYLSQDNRQKALKISKTLFYLKDSFLAGIDSVNVLKKEALKSLIPTIDVQYIEFVDSKTLELRNDKVFAGDRTLIAGFIKTESKVVRLIDNILL